MLVVFRPLSRLHLYVIVAAREEPCANPEQGKGRNRRENCGHGPLCCRRGRDRRRLYADLLHDGGEQVVKTAFLLRPAAEVYRVQLAEPHRRLGIVEAHRNQLADLSRLARLVAHPMAFHTFAGPCDDAGPGRIELRLDIVGEIVPAGQVPVPPDRITGVFERLCQPFDLRAIRPGVGEEDIGHQLAVLEGAGQAGVRGGSTSIGIFSRSTIFIRLG